MLYKAEPKCQLSASDNACFLTSVHLVDKNALFFISACFFSSTEHVGCTKRHMKKRTQSNQMERNAFCLFKY